MECRSQALIIDPGSDLLKAGFSGEDLPCAVVPDVVGVREFSPGDSEDSDKKIHHIGHDVHRRRAYLKLHYPVTNGITTNFDMLEKVVRHVCKDVLLVDSSEYPLLFTEHPVPSLYLREKLIQFAFEDLDVPKFFVQDTASLSLIYSGLLSGTVLESGDAVTTTSVVVEGLLDRDTIPKTFYAGRDVSYDLFTMLTKNGYEFHSIDKKYLREIKETLGFISLDFERDLSLALNSGTFEQTYQLPSGETITINEERFKCCEGLFHPERFGCDSPGIHMQVKRTLELADDDYRPLAGKNIVLSGGNTMFSGFKERLQKELDDLCVLDCMFGNIHDSVDRNYAAWVGGSMMTSLSSMQDKWITKQEYEEEGAYLVERKCF